MGEDGREPGQMKVVGQRGMTDRTLSESRERERDVWPRPFTCPQTQVKSWILTEGQQNSCFEIPSCGTWSQYLLTP